MLLFYKNSRLRKERNMFGNDALIQLAFILLVGLLTALAVSALTFIILWIHSTCSYKKRMKPLNEAVEKQRRESEEKRRMMFSQ